MTHGRLKIFLSYADGAGKTTAMLSDALQQKARGVDVLAAWVNLPDGSEARQLLERLEALPPSPDGLNLDEILRRRPQLVLMDELEGINPEGSRHQVRWQDVEELLQAGISVYTTLNILHVESLKDTVEEITGQRIEQTVPDRLLDRADELEVVDLPPEELLERLHSHTPATLADTLRHKSNLLALRQLTMRRAAMRMEDQARALLGGVKSPLSAERICVCISNRPEAERLVREGRMLADALNAEWFVLYVETPTAAGERAEERASLLKAMRLAEENGASTLMMPAESIAEGIEAFCRQQGVTRLVLGKPRNPLWRMRLGVSPVERFLRSNLQVDVILVDTPRQTLPRRGTLPRWWAYLRNGAVVFMAVLLVTALGLGLRQQPGAIGMEGMYLLLVIALAFWLGRSAGLLAAGVSTLAFAWFFNGDSMALNGSDLPLLITFLGWGTAGLVTASLARAVRRQTRAMRWRQVQSAVLNALSRELAGALDLQAVMNSIVRHVSGMMGGTVMILLLEEGQLKLARVEGSALLSERDWQIARWVVEHRAPAGLATNTFADSAMRFLPLMAHELPIGVLVVLPEESSYSLLPEQREILDGVAGLASLAIERVRLNQQAQQAAVLQMTEKLQTALLNSISHDLRTPLSAVEGSLSSLLEAEANGLEMDRETRLDLLENASEEAERLNRLVGNLLDMTRIEAGALRIRRRPCDVQDLIGTALTQFQRRLQDRKVLTRIAPNLPEVEMDFVLIEQVLERLLDNAVKYSPPGSEITVSAEVVNEALQISVADRGEGIPPEDLERIFGKFYRVQRPDGVSGTGLGLSICKGIVEIHGGRIWAENRPEGGAIFTFTIPLTKLGESK
ncbi:MAG: sensor histidine kinase KdpD [Anaerolinea sp.]